MHLPQRSPDVLPVARGLRVPSGRPVVGPLHIGQVDVDDPLELTEDFRTLIATTGPHDRYLEAVLPSELDGVDEVW